MRQLVEQRLSTSTCWSLVLFPHTQPLNQLTLSGKTHLTQTVLIYQLAVEQSVEQSVSETIATV